MKYDLSVVAMLKMLGYDQLQEIIDAPSVYLLVTVQELSELSYLLKMKVGNF